MRPVTWCLAGWTLLSIPSGIAGELPERANRLVPTTWSMPLDPAGSSPVGLDTVGDWARAVGGESLWTLFQQADASQAVTGAQATVQQTEGRATQAAAGWLPSVTGTGSWTLGTPNAAFAQYTDSHTMAVYNASIDASLPLTPWTAVPDQRAARADRLAALAALDDTRADARLDVATAWLDWAQAGSTLAIQQRLATVQAELLSVAEARYSAADVAGVDVLQQRQQVSSTRASLPAAEADVGRAERALSTLLRLPPDALPEPPQALPEPVLPTLPSPRDLVERDPGVQAALQTWQGDQARTRSAHAALAPSLALSAGGGVRYTQLVDQAATPTWSAGVSVSIPLFDGGLTVGRIQERRGTQAQSLTDLEQAVADLVREAEDAIALWQQTTRARTATEEARQLALAALEAARVGYAAGTSTYNTVLTAVQTAQTASLDALQAQRDQVDAAIALLGLVRAAWTTSEDR